MSRRRSEPPTESERILGEHDASLLDIVDNVLNKGVVLTGDVTIALAQVDLVYARLSLLLCAADRVFPEEDTDFQVRHHRRHELRKIRRRQEAARSEAVKTRFTAGTRGRRA